MNYSSFLGFSVVHNYKEVYQNFEDYKEVTTNYVYDQLNRLKNINYPNASENVSFTYDALSRLQKATNYAGVVDFNYTKRNQVSQVIDVNGHKVNYTYDPAGNPNLMSLDEVQQVDYQFDKVNRLQVIKNSEDNTQVDYNYDAANRLTRKILPNGIETAYQYDGMSRMSRLRDFKTNPDTTQTNLYNRQYSYDTASNIAQIKIGNQTKNYNYDLIDRLTQVTATTPTQNENYSFDAVGNRTTSHLSTTYQYAAFNKLTNSQQASFVYDSNGNMVTKTDASGTTQYVWDFENRLRQIIKPDGGTVSYKFDALGRRSEQLYGNGFSTKFTYDGEDVILDVNSDGTSVKYLNGLGVDNKISLKTNGGATQYFVQDHLGSTSALTDASGNVSSSATYDSYGNATGNLATRYQYTGREYDSFTGLHYYRARFYDGNLGRFISEDPIGFGGGDVNLFAYVQNAPLNRTDPSGLLDTGNYGEIAEKLKEAAKAGGATAGAGAGLWGTLGTIGATTVSAAPATACAVGVAGFGLGYGIGYYPGQWLANASWNPYPNGPLNPFPYLDRLTQPQSPPQPTLSSPPIRPPTSTPTPRPERYRCKYNGISYPDGPNKPAKCEYECKSTTGRTFYEYKPAPCSKEPYGTI